MSCIITTIPTAVSVHNWDAVNLYNNINNIFTRRKNSIPNRGILRWTSGQKTHESESRVNFSRGP